MTSPGLLTGQPNANGQASSQATTPTTAAAPTLTTPASSTILIHVDVGNVFKVQIGDEVKDIVVPATVKMVSNDANQPVPIQFTSPSPGQIVQQIVDENGILTDLILTSQPQQQQHHGQHHPQHALVMPLQSPSRPVPPSAMMAPNGSGANNQSGGIVSHSSSTSLLIFHICLTNVTSRPRELRFEP